MKKNKTKFSTRAILLSLSLNWVAVILFTAYFASEDNPRIFPILATLVVGFTLQLSFLSDQLKKHIK